MMGHLLPAHDKGTLPIVSPARLLLTITRSNMCHRILPVARHRVGRRLPYRHAVAMRHRLKVTSQPCMSWKR